MTYKEFIYSLSILIQQEPEQQQDPDVIWMINYVKQDKLFPDYVLQVAQKYYLIFNEKQTLAFQKTIMFYLHMESNFADPNDQDLKTINAIIELQNNDPNYKYRTRY